MKPKCVSFHAVPACLFLALASPGFANDDMSIFSGVTPINCNNGWQDWGWVPHYLTNNPAWNGNYTMAFAASGGYQAWYLEHDPINTTIYNSISFWLNGGSHRRADRRPAGAGRFQLGAADPGHRAHQ